MRAIKIDTLLFLFISCVLYVMLIFWIMSFYKLHQISWADMEKYFMFQDVIAIERAKYCLYLYLYNKTLINYVINNPNYILPTEYYTLLKNTTYFYYIPNKKFYEELENSKDFQKFMKKCMPKMYLEFPNYSIVQDQNGNPTVKGTIMHIYEWYLVHYENLFNSSDNFTVGHDFSHDSWNSLLKYYNTFKMVFPGLLTLDFLKNNIENLFGAKCNDFSNYEKKVYVTTIPTLEVDEEGNLYKVRLIKVEYYCG